MGNSASSSSYRTHHEDTVDFGYLTPQGVYAGSRDWKEDVVSQLIIDRKIAPFYRPLEDYDISWDDDQILAARKDPPAPVEQDGTGPRSDAPPPSKSTHHKRQSISKELPRNTEAAIYRDATECPICFLYYPPNINHSRCCDQSICSECFVQLKRAEPTTTHMVSEPACCPFCVQENFGVVYTPPPWRTGIGSEGSAYPTWPDSPKGSQRSFDSTKARQGKQRRSKTYDHTDPDVVTVDQIHPDWEAKLAAVQAAAARRANRRIIMRQIGDRLIPVGITSGRIHPLSVEPAGGGEGEGGGGGGSRRSRRRQQQQQDLNNFLGNLGFGGRDLEELMMMEAMRLSLLEHEAQQRREAEERARNGAEDSSSQSRTEGRNSPSSPRATEASPDVGSSTAESALTPPTSNISPAPSSPNLTNMSSPSPQPLSESPHNDSGDLHLTPHSFQSSPHPTSRHPTVSRMDSSTSSVAPNGPVTGLEGYRFLTSESEESVMAREPLLDRDV